MTGIGGNLWNGLFFPSPLARLYPHCLIFLYVNLGICMMVVYNISIAYIIRNVLELSPTNHAREIAAAKGGGVALDPQSTFQQGQPSSLVLPGEDDSEKVTYIEGRSSTPQMGEFALLLAPNGQILASSYPVSYPVSTSAAHLLPEQKQLILNALAGRGGSTITITAQVHIISAAEPVLGNERKPIGAIYVQGTSPAFNGYILSYIV